MELPVLIERLPDGVHYTARLGEPFNLTVEAPTPEEAQDRIREAVRRRLDQGAELRAISVRASSPAPPEGGRLPDDELTREWLQAVRQVRDEADEADRRRLSEGAAEGKAAS